MKLKALSAGLLLAGNVAAWSSFDDAVWVDPDHPAIRYWSDTDDPVARLEKRLESGTAQLDYANDGRGYLASILHHLDINPDSQMLVFSKTSFQAVRISPATPRAIYFNDSVAVGFVRTGEVFEVAALDPRQGEVFYTLNMAKSEAPRFARREVCLQCHQGPATVGVPGIFVSSVYPDANGQPNRRTPDFATDDRTPLERRWGGWYVTGQTGSQRHMGNSIAPDWHRPQELEREGTQNLTSLGWRVSTAPYLLPTSDVVALMTLEHQTRMTSLITRASWDTRIAQQTGRLDDPAIRAEMDADLNELVAYMLFGEEAKLREPIQGVSTFTRTFPERGPRDRKGRSLRDFDLRTRMFRYPLSYMIYSEAFDAMPEYDRERIWRRLYDVLTGKDSSNGFGSLSPEDRRAIIEIVRNTKPGLPGYWRLD